MWPDRSVHIGTPCVTSEKGASTGSLDTHLPEEVAGKGPADLSYRGAQMCAVASWGWGRGRAPRAEARVLFPKVTRLVSGRLGGHSSALAPGSEQDRESMLSTAHSSTQGFASELIHRRALIEAASVSF